MKIEFCSWQIFKKSIMHKSSVGSREVPPKNVEPDRFSCFVVYWIQTYRHPNKQTNKQTPRQAKYIYIKVYMEKDI